MASQTEGVLRLLAAEKLAAEKVSEARRRKARRLKQAKDEAEAEVNAYKVGEKEIMSLSLIRTRICRFQSEREREYLDYETRNAGSQDDVALRIEEDTKKKV